MKHIQLKWGKEKYSLDVNTKDVAEVFKQQVFSLTLVPPERQKILGLKKKKFDDDEVLDEAGFVEGKTYVLIGTADKAPEPPEPRKKMEEEEEEGVTYLEGRPPGLANLGNTCYLNSCLQTLSSVKSLSTAVIARTESAPSGLLRDLGNLFQEMSEVEYKKVVVPGTFVRSFRTTFPQFAEQSQPGLYQQQDAEEVWSILLEALAAYLPAPEGSHRRNLVHELFGCDMHEIYTNTELDEIEEKESISLKIPVNIRKDIIDISYAFNGGIDDGTVEKYSARLERDAVFQKRTFMTRLPPYLVVQMVRFEWRRDTAKRAKILKAVKFPVVLDLAPACMDTLSESLIANRRMVEENPSLKIDTGLYELCAVITHKGRYAHAGHYISWVKQDDGVWLCFDDDAVFEAPDEDIPRLCGGGDWHMAYILLYRNRRASGDAVMKGK
eukprot:TRINITY_DN1103_c0_g2_i1.p1 TRINITY_DN1103_c0_g2~~TRINITY_DN1103_c0_g2_i1.p1  ORF type:complete len:439 (-),score=125.36 TRINITY_DN1103_c0_g2_i1:185-1501(-)